jgi:hypothetical protein
MRAGAERDADAADADRRRLWLDLGHASLFSFLHRELGPMPLT